jgi:hypothetical protein
LWINVIVVFPIGNKDTIILPRHDHLSFSVYNHGFDPEEFFVEDFFTLNNWIRALQQHIVDIGIN